MESWENSLVKVVLFSILSRLFLKVSAVNILRRREGNKSNIFPKK